MKNFLNQLPSKWRKFTEFLQNKKTRKYSRITYGVVWNLLLLFIILTVLGFSFAGGVGAGYFAAMVKDEPVRTETELKKDIYNYEETSEIYFANNVYLGKLQTDLEREEVALDQVSQHLRNAVIATEDEYFYEHDGVVPKAIMRALYQEMTNSAVQSGGSTLTQQLIKNQVLTNEVSFERKAKEILLALRVEKFLEKDEIMQTYLNVSTFGRNSSGQNIAGVQSAAEGIFGKDAKDLNIPQSAFIAGLPQSPFGYTPYTPQGTIKENLEPGQNRMKTVLKRMRDGNYITEKEYQDALKYDLTKDFIGKKPSPIEDYPWVTYEIEKRSIEILSKILAKEDGYEESELKKDKDLKEQYVTLANRNLRQNGYKIHSTIDKKIYDQMEKVAKNYQYYGSARPEEVTDPETNKTKTVMEPVETGAVLIENKTGKVISFVGGRDHDREQTNHATVATRPNGSTMKPLLVYGPGIELGKLAPGSVKVNVPVRMNPRSSNPYPNNYGGGYTGLSTAREALAKSYNVPAALFYKDIMNQKPTKYLEKMGFTSLHPVDHTNLSLSLGGMEDGVTVEENVNAYATFANSGKFVDAYMIDKIETKDGKVIYQHKAKPVDVFTPQASYLTIDMMRDVVSSGTAASLRGRLAFSADWAGKTGTTQEYKDAWFVASNPNVTFGTWIGYDTPKSLEQNYRGVSYSKRNINLWAQLMNAAYKVQPELVAPQKRFEMPGGIVRRSFCAVSGLLPSDACSKAGMVQTDLFIAKFVPGQTDNSFSGFGRFVQIGSKRYAALPSTPSEFTSGGFTVSLSNFEQIGGNYVIDPGSIFHGFKKGSGSTLSSNAVLNDNGKAPSPLSASIKGNTIVWGKHPEGDVIGYRVYNNGRKVASINAGGKLSFSGGGGSYYVTAVDIAGKESAPSNIVSKDGKQVSADKPKTEKPKENKPKPAVPKPVEEPKPEPEAPPADPAVPENPDA
ncbi:transglycosylase domain-containing protein [Bacillus sp. CECT 9360]|uniref:transglycosylase domain-containing protein n=1 Tax=Bacillus sp. CECT 9360 TaxID=2845821 RepID=UPI001E5EF3B9|nr:transglycosylase domain-containing protein [Bacillus sp. CECT 9360]CAH0346850.1 Biosynthetic peptidoglycan transglycosylase [Bacillus sp. CECT 9360]